MIISIDLVTTSLSILVTGEEDLEYIVGNIDPDLFAIERDMLCEVDYKFASDTSGKCYATIDYDANSIKIDEVPYKDMTSTLELQIRFVRGTELVHYFYLLVARINPVM